MSAKFFHCSNSNRHSLTGIFRPGPELTKTESPTTVNQDEPQRRSQESNRTLQGRYRNTGAHSTKAPTYVGKDECADSRLQSFPREIQPGAWQSKSPEQRLTHRLEQKQTKGTKLTDMMSVRPSFSSLPSVRSKLPRDEVTKGLSCFVPWLFQPCPERGIHAASRFASPRFLSRLSRLKSALLCSLWLTSYD